MKAGACAILRKRPFSFDLPVHPLLSKSIFQPLVAAFIAFGVCIIAACAPTPAANAFRATEPPADATAPLYTASPTFTTSPTRTPTPPETETPLPSATPLPDTDTAAAAPTSSPSPTETAPAPYRFPTLVPAEGWSCGDFPCADDIDGFLRRIQVPEGYRVEPLGRFPGQVMQLAYGPDGRLYAAVLENGTRRGSVYVMDEAGNTQIYSGRYHAPVGLAFAPNGTLYVSGRVTPDRDGGIWWVPPGGGEGRPLITNLPCCFSLDNQPNGMIFGPDGWLYLGVAARSDHGERGELQRLEASIVRVDPISGETDRYARGLRAPYDLAFDSTGRLFATDLGVLTGPGDRVVEIIEGGNYGWPFWRDRGCADCPALSGGRAINGDLVTFEPFSLPRGLVAYQGEMFPPDQRDKLFIALWNGAPHAQRIVRIDPDRPDEPPQPFLTGLIRPVDVTVAPDGALVAADYIYGHVWRVVYIGQ